MFDIYVDPSALPALLDKEYRGAIDLQTRILNLKKEEEDAVTRECTFSPRINRNSSLLSGRRTKPKVCPPSSHLRFVLQGSPAVDV